MISRHFVHIFQHKNFDKPIINNLSNSIMSVLFINNVNICINVRYDIMVIF